MWDVIDYIWWLVGICVHAKWLVVGLVYIADMYLFLKLLWHFEDILPLGLFLCLCQIPYFRMCVNTFSNFLCFCSLYFRNLIEPSSLGIPERKKSSKMIKAFPKESSCFVTKTLICEYILFIQMFTETQDQELTRSRGVSA